MLDLSRVNTIPFDSLKWEIFIWKFEYDEYDYCVELEVVSNKESFELGRDGGRIKLEKQSN